MPTLQKGGGPMCACGHTKSSHRPGECVGCTGPECGASCTCAGVGLRIKLAALTGTFEHATGCKTNPSQNVRPDGACRATVVAPEGLGQVDLMAAMSEPNPHAGCADAGCGPDCPARLYADD